MGGWRRNAILGVLLGALLPVVGAAATEAAVYHVYSCHTPAGEVASTEGWNASANGPDTYAFDDCAGASTRSLTVALGGAVAHPANVSNALWEFGTAPGLKLSGATLYRHEGLPGGAGPAAAYLTFFATPNLAYDAADVFDACQANTGCRSLGTPGSGLDWSNRLVVPPGNVGGATQLFMEAACGGVTGAACPTSPGYAAEADLYAADLTVEDASAPVVANLGGSLLGGGTLTGATEVWFSAYDQGSGVYQARLSLDGQPFAAKVLDENLGRCKTIGQASDGLRDFGYQTPCKPAVSADLRLDTGLLRDGRHRLQISVDDAAGNLTSVYDGTILTRNAPLGGEPQITGVLEQGQTLTANPGTWSPAPSAFAFQWLRCDAGSNCHPIAGATQQTYVAAAQDAYQWLAVDVTASDAAGSMPGRAAPLGPIADRSGATTGPAGSVTAQAGGLIGAGRQPSAGHLANGGGACEAARLSAAFGAGPVGHAGLRGGATLHGSLVCAGHPVDGAVVEVSIAQPGERQSPATAEVRTARDGSFAFVVPPGPSSEVSLSYRAFADQAGPPATATARLQVRPSIGLSIRPVRVRNGQTIVYRGRVFGGHIPAAGLPLEVQYRDGRRWRTFDLTRAQAGDGRFVYRYTFRRTTIPIVYTFRVAIPASGAPGYPYAANASRPRSVRVDP